jgi:nitric oxide reductase NorD protein
MEEWVGRAWHRLITRASQAGFPYAEVTLEEVRQPAGMLFRALGGDGGLRLEAATETEHRARRGLVSRLAGSNRTVGLAWRDEETLRLPSSLCCLPSRALNRELYLWLAALASLPGRDATASPADWLCRNARASAQLLEAYPGLRSRYHRLVAAHLPLRPDPGSLPSHERAREVAIRQALRDPSCHADINWPRMTEERYRPEPVPLWLNPDPPGIHRESLPPSADGESRGDGTRSEEVETKNRKRGEYVDEPDENGGLIAFRLESLFTRTEYVAVDRTQEENEDQDVQSGVEDLDVLSMSKQRGLSGARLRFDLDLPGADYDDHCLGEGIPLPEWDYRRQSLLPAHCRLQLMHSRELGEDRMPPRLQARARRLRHQFEMLRPRKIWQPRQREGSELDTDAIIQQASDRKRGHAGSEAALFREFRNLDRDLSSLVLADLSLSTGAHVNDDSRVIDVIRDSLHLLSEALDGTGDRYALYGFSSKNRDHVRFHEIKPFGNQPASLTHARINAIKPGYYTRMGAAIRYASRLLDRETSTQKLLLILTDGKPNDLDKYEGRYGVEDTRQAVREAVQLGLQPFCITIDRKAADYLPYIFSRGGWVLVRDAAQLPDKLPALYARLTG